MKLLVLGHSDSDGSMLPDPSNGWPWVIQRQLNALGHDVEITHRMLYAAPTASRFVERELARHSPDIVVVATSTHGVLFQLTSIRVREVLGERAGSMVARLERFVSTHNGDPESFRGKATLRARRVARKALRAKSDLTVEELIRIYSDCFDVLARAENTQTIILAGVGYTPWVEAQSPGFSGLQGRIAARLKALALEHHFDWLVHEELLGGPSGKMPYYLDDGVHTNEQSQQMVADAMLPLVAARL
ncbi:MAG: hypothetical protein AB7N24_13645 [Dehalococcoidia bacterium]